MESRKTSRSRDWFLKAPIASIKLQELFTDLEFNALSLAAQAVAIRAGWLCFALGEVPDDPFVVAQMTMGDANEFERQWPAVRRIFITLDNGNLTHDWWTEKREAAYMRQARARIAAKLSHSSRKQKH